MVIQKAKIVIVDDEPINLEILSSVLADKYEIIFAQNSSDALRLLERNKGSVDLILLDVVMPGIDGYELCKIIKSKEEFKDIPIIFVTAKDMSEDEEYGLKIGAIDYIFKPYRPNAIRLKVDNHLKIKQSVIEQKSKLLLLSPTLSIDTQSATAIDGEKKIILTKKELELIELLFYSSKRILSKEEIEDTLWSGKIIGESSLKSLVRKVRLKIGHEWIENVKNIGYRFKNL